MYWRCVALSRAALFKAVLFAAGALNTLEAQPKVTVAPLDASLAPALTAALPSDPSFQPSIENLLTPAVLAIFKPVLPYSIVVRNQSSIPVVAVVAYVDVVDAEGHSSSEMQASGNIPPFDKNDFLLAPGKDMLFTADRQYGGEAIRVMREGIKQPDARLEQLAQRPVARYASAASITFVLDSIVLADGTFVGPDKPHAYGGLVSRLATEAQFARAVLAFQGHKPDELLQYLAKVAAELEPHHADGSVTQAQLARQYLLVFRQKGPQSVFDLAAKDHERATAFSLHR
jgi:hypothetical protein